MRTGTTSPVAKTRAAAASDQRGYDGLRSVNAVRITAAAMAPVATTRSAFDQGAARAASTATAKAMRYMENATNKDLLCVTRTQDNGPTTFLLSLPVAFPRGGEIASAHPMSPPS